MSSSLGRVGPRRQVLRAKVAIVAALAAVMMLAPGASATGGTDPGYARALAFRTEFGLSTDPDVISATLADPTASTTFGVPLRAAEVDDLMARQAVVEGIGPMTTALQVSDSFGGLYVDQHRGGLVVVDEVSKDAQIDAGLKLAPLGAHLQIAVVVNSWRHLQDVQATVDADIGALQKEGIQFSASYADPVSNKVIVKIVGLTDAVRQELSSRYGPTVDVQAGDPVSFAACTSRSACAPPDKGGLAINYSGGGCTSAFLGRPTSSFSHLYVLTAGHCLADSGLSATWTHNSVALGTGAFEDWYNRTIADVGGINDVESGAKNQIMAGGTSDIRSITSGASNSQQPVGAGVCRAGRTSGYDCASITSTNVTQVVGNITVYHYWVFHLHSSYGDSGSPIFASNRAYGILSAIDSGLNTYYSTLDWINSLQGVRPCYTSTCG
jgi:hypothetical protein